ncbi:FLU1-II protein [Exidia glandulosa HHB12029]|uniref:Glutamine synthetase n=1 Tax=Exidia glandulosa HHB12029 TaxID=1314781 RepID=A0A165FCT6_EXIGL|nr:FLU1-II protein [Exidia glandulosa HHB12029]
MSSAEQYRALSASLRANSVTYVRLAWVDLIGWTRYRVIPIAQFDKLLKSARPGVRLTEASLGLVFMQLADGFHSSGEYLYVVDPSSMRLCNSYAAGHAIVMGWFERAIPSPNAPLSVPLCPRGQLRRIVTEAERTHGVKIRMGFEVEVIFLKSAVPLDAVNDFGWSLSKAIPSGSVIAQVLEEIANGLQHSGVELLMYHAEAAPGQYEFVTNHLPPLEAVDALIATKETISNIASKYGLQATQAPRLYNDTCGSGLHVHLSVSSSRASASANVPSAPGFSALEASFLQGMLDHLPGVCALSLPTDASYARMLDGIWSGGTWASWGRENRESAIRVCGEEGNYHFEVRAHDGTACSYIAMAALIAGGMRGVRSSAPLVTKDCQKLASSLSGDERRELGISRRMPLKLEEARQYLTQDQEMKADLGEDFVKTFLAVNETLQSALKDETEEKTIKKLVDHY